MSQPETRNEDDTTSTNSNTTTITPAWHSAVAGGLAGLTSRMVTAPLDLVRIRRQLYASQPPQQQPYPSSLWATWQSIYRHGGVTALYRGNLAALYLWMGYAAVQFSVYQTAHEAMRRPTTGRGVEHCDDDSDDNDTDNDNDPKKETTIAPTRRGHGARATVSAFVAGATAGVCATLATYPFDVCRTTFVVAQGAVVGDSGSVSTTTTHTAGQRPVPPQRPPVPSMPFSSLYEAPLHPPMTPRPVVTPPITNINPLPTSFAQFVSQLYRTKGIPGFYAGAVPAVWQIVPYMGLNFCLYEYLSSSSSSFKNDSGNVSSHANTSVLTSAYAGSISGATSKLCVYPLDTVKRRLQGQAFAVVHPTTTTTRSTATLSRSFPGHGRHYRGMWDCIVTVYRQEGLRAFYRGMVPSVLKTAISTSLSFSVFRWTTNVLQQQQQQG